MKNRVVLEMSPSPLLLENGDGTTGKEILRGKNWRKHLIFLDGEYLGLSLGCRDGRAYDETLAAYAANGVKFYPAGQWEAAQAETGDTMPPIRAEVLAVIQGKAEK